MISQGPSDQSYPPCLYQDPRSTSLAFVFTGVFSAMSPHAPEDILSDPLITQATALMKTHMSRYDASHDIHHVVRVVRLARHIYSRSPPTNPPLDERAVILSALLHDMADRKYLSPTEDASTLVHGALVACGCPAALAEKVQSICHGVSYSAEVRDPARVAELLDRYPELAVVQDADRLDAIGAVGIGRMFTYGGAMMPDRSLAGAMGHLDEKLLRLEGMMKTDEGRRLARERTERLRAFKEWWLEESRFGEADFALCVEDGEEGVQEDGT